MNSAQQQALEHRVLILAPTGRDAALASSILGDAGIACVATENLEAVVREVRAGAGAVLVAEEQIANGHAREFAAVITEQPAWSDLPVLVLTRHGADSPVVLHAMEALGNVTLLERPARVVALVSAVRVALRARDRQYEMRAQLRERERRNEEMQTLLDTLPVGVFIAHDATCSRISGNHRGCEILGMSTDANLSMTAPRDERPAHFKALQGGVEIAPEELPVQRAARGAAVLGSEIDLVFDGGRTVHTIISASPLFDSDGRSRGAVAAIVDVTAQKKAEAALREADRKKDEFLATLAHELRNPLAPICNSIHVLQLMDGASPAAAGVCEMMERQANHMVRLVDDLLDVSRITRGKVELRRERVELAAILRSAVETSRPLIDAGRHELSVTLPPEPLTLEADAVRLAQVFANLLNNAAKYTDDGGAIGLAAARRDREVVVSVRDNGAGIPHNVLPRVFDMFAQADRTRGGLGIGLTLAKSLVEMHGGRIEARSDGPQRGSEFIVRLPLLADAAPPRQLAAPPQPSRLPSAVRVLIVDDNLDAAKSLGLVLELLGAEVRVVNDGKSALALLESYSAAVVLLDLGMSEMDGYEVARRIREQQRLPRVTLIALTGWGQEEDRRRTRETGFDHHLVKPPDMNALQQLIASAAASSVQRPS